MKKNHHTSAYTAFFELPSLTLVYVHVPVLPYSSICQIIYPPTISSRFSVLDLIM